MKRYRCSVCGYIYDEEQERRPFSDLKECPVCHQPTEKFTVYEEERNEEIKEKKEVKLEYPKEFVRQDESCRYMKEIHEIAVTGKSISAAMGTEMPMPGWDDILILGAQLDPMPLEETAQVRTETVIGRHARKPLVLENPVYISHMSFGALSREAKISLARGSALAHSAMCSGEGGILPEEMEAADKYIKMLQIKTASRETPIKSLSGGNQQKVIIGRWLLTNPDFLILDEPTRGIDIGTKTEIQKLVLDLADQGMSVAFISSEVEEMLRTCSRMAVMRDGKKVGEISGDELSQEGIMKAIAGGEE